MSKEMDLSFKTMKAASNTYKMILDEILKMLDVLLKDRDNLKEEEFKKYSDAKNVAEMFKDHVSNGGMLVPIKCTQEDIELIESKLTENDKAYIDMVENKNDKAFVGEFNNNHFAFDNLPIKTDKGDYIMYIKNTDLLKFRDFKEYLDEHQIPNNISVIEKDIRNLLKIDETKELLSMEIPKQKSFEIIANTLNVYKIPFEVANEEYGIRIIFEKEKKKEVIHAIFSCNSIDEQERAFLINQQIKEINNRTEAETTVKEMLNDAPTMPDILKNDKDEGNEMD